MLIDGVKFSCDACTRGHRQNSCKHADRPLHEVPKRGRPPTACAECRELRKNTNTHRTCSHRKESDDGPDILLKTLPNGAADLASVELVRRSSSVKSRSSASAASVASTSAASASEDDLASIGRRKSLSRTSSISRPGSSARSEKPKKPHDLAHGHLADHPTHVSAAYSPYPHHPPNKEHHHHHHMHVPSPLARSDAGSSGRGTGANNSPVASGSAGIPPVPPVPALPADFALAASKSFAQHSSPAIASQFGPTALPTGTNVPLPMPPPPALLPAAPPPLLLPQQQPLFAAPAPQQPPPPPPEAPMSNEQLASAFFFRDFPPEAKSSSQSPDASQYGPAVAGGNNGDRSRDRSRERVTNLLLPQPATIKRELPAYPFPPPQQQQQLTVLPTEQYTMYASPPLVSPATSLESLAAIDPAAAAYVLGDSAQRNSSLPLAPMYGEGELYYSDSGPLPVDEQTFDAFAPSSNGGDGYVDYRNVPPASSSASSDIYEFPPTNPAVYGYPLESVSSHDPSSYSGYESAASVTGGAAAALERLDLDFDLPRRTPPAGAGAEAAQRRPQPPARIDSSASSSAASAVPQQQFMPGDDVQTTDLDGILEWLASSTAAGGLPPPPPSSRGDPTRHDSASSSVATWPSAPPSSYGDSVGAGYGAGAMYAGGGGWTSYSESDIQQRYSPPVPVSSSSASGQAAGAGARTGGVTWATRSDDNLRRSRAEAADEDDDDEEEENSAGERIGNPRAKRERNADLEMLRTATITCRDASFSASASDSPDHAGTGAHDPNAWDSTRANSPRLDSDGNPFPPNGAGGTAPRYARGHAFAAFIGDEFDRFGLGGELDDDWFRQFGVGSGGVGSGLSGLAGLGDGEGEIGEDDGYEEDDEASVVGVQVSNPFEGGGDGFGDGYEREREFDYDVGGGGGYTAEEDDELGWDRDQTFGAGPLPSTEVVEEDSPASIPSAPVGHQGNDTGSQIPAPSAAIDVVGSHSSRSDPDNGPYDDGRRDHSLSSASGSISVTTAGFSVDDQPPMSPTSPQSRLAAYLEQQEAKNEEDGHDRGAGMWW
ncbi:hypothetical protein JCM10908_007371 [Rhodotorula pacifica]|uniref:copper fist DNA-binding domain-containing protein n=1 Tax=Rhodotorula pacifica TaxID=1495444 RepID=UPI003182071E